MFGLFFQAKRESPAVKERRDLEKALARLIASQLPEPEQRKSWLFGTDVTPRPRLFSLTLPDRTIIYQPNTIAGNTPIAIGHQYSVTAFLPEKKYGDPPWVVPLVVHRITSNEKGTIVGADAITLLMEDKELPFHDELCVHVGASTRQKCAGIL